MPAPPKKWPAGVSQQVVSAAISNNAGIVKRRPSYVYAGFDSDGDRTSFTSALSGIPNISASNIDHPDEPSMFFKKVVPT